MNDEKERSELSKECRRLEENCLYTAAGLYYWSKSAKRLSNFFLVAPIVAGGAAGSELILSLGGDSSNIIVASFALLAGVLPSVFKALELEANVKSITSSAAEFTNLRDRFRQCGKFLHQKDEDSTYLRFEELVKRLEKARENCPPLPDKFFRAAQEAIKKGNYENSVDGETP